MITFEPNPLRPLDEGMAMAKDWLQSRKIPNQYAVVEKVMSNIDRTRLAALIAIHEPRRDLIGGWKYLDLPYWLARCARNASVLGLEKFKGGNVLDIGSGGCHWLAICKAHGFRATGLEIKLPNAISNVDPAFRPQESSVSSLQIYDELEIMLKTRRFYQWLMPKAKMRTFNRKFNIVTSYLACFHRIRRDKNHGLLPLDRQTHFSNQDWAFFLNDLVDRHLNFPAIIHLELNADLVSESGKRMHDPALLEWFTAQGATIGRGGFRGAITFELPEPRRFR